MQYEGVDRNCERTTTVSFGQGQGQVCHIDGQPPVMERYFKKKNDPWRT